MSESCALPEFDLQQATQIARDLFALDGPIRLLNGERDLNFLIEVPSGKFVFKIANIDESPAMLECQHQVFDLLSKAQAFPGIVTALASVNGQLIEYTRSPGGLEHACRVLPFIDGCLLDHCNHLESGLLEELGQSLAQLDLALEGFSHPALERPLLWEMRDGLDRIDTFKPLLKDDAERSLVEYFETGFRQRVIAVETELRLAVIHNDANKGNVLVNEACNKLVGIIDFGDMVHSWLVVEPAIAATYAMLDQPEPMRNAQAILRGYHRTLPLTDVEIGVMFDLICMRLCMSVCICAYQRGLAPDNEYLSVDEKNAWDLLSKLRQIDHTEAQAFLRDGL
jgi:Ser/Thr protein kinase RdoA (MazF antagonist)